MGCCPSSVICRALTSSSQELIDQSYPNLVCSICRGRRKEIFNFKTPPPPPRRGNFGVKCVKLMYFFKSLLLYSGAWFRQTKCIVMITREGSTKIVNFMSPGAGVLLLGHGHKVIYWKCIISLKIFFFPPRHRSNKLSI